MSESKVDLVFQVMGKTIPVDHGYPLYSAISKVLNNFHEEQEVYLSPIRGRYVGNGILDIQPKSELTLRLPIANLRSYINLAGKKLDILGHAINIGVPNTQALVPAPALYAHLVTTKNGNFQFRFDAEIRRQLSELGIKGSFQIGERRTLAVHKKQMVGYSLFVNELTAEESILLQETGLGGRHKMGCGFFLPKGKQADEI